jgi:hypothetical protein
MAIEISRRDQRVNAAIFQLPKERQSLLSGRVTLAADVTGDIASLVRYIGSFALDQINRLTDALGGMTSGLGILVGGVGYLKASQNAETAKGLGDSKGVRDAQLTRGWKALQTGGALTYLVYRVLSLAALVKYGAQVDVSSVNAATGLGRMTAGVGIFGTVVFIIFYVLLGIYFSYGLLQGQKLINKWEKKKEEPAAFAKNQLTVSVSTLREKMTKKITKEAASQGQTLSKEELEKALYTQLLRETRLFGRAWVEDHLKKNGDTHSYSKRELTDIFHGMYESNKFASVRGYLAFRVEALQLKREHALGRLIGSGLVTEIKKAQGSTLQGLNEKVAAAAKFNRNMNAAMVAVSVVGLVGTILSLIFMAGIPAIVVTALFLIAGIGMFVSDAYCLHQSLQSSEKGPWDLRVMVASIVISLLLTITAAALTYFLVLPIIPLVVIMGLITLGWIATQGATIYITQRSRKDKAPVGEVEMKRTKKAKPKRETKEEEMNLIVSHAAKHVRLKRKKRVA